VGGNKKLEKQKKLWFWKQLKKKKLELAYFGTIQNYIKISK